MKINIDFFKTGSVVYILTHSGITEVIVRDANITSDGDIIYYLASADNKFAIRLSSHLVYESHSDILSLIQSQIPKEKEDETTTTEAEVANTDAV